MPGMFPVNISRIPVLFAMVLFFASASGKFEQRRVRVVAAFAAAVFASAIVRSAMLPR